MATRVWLLSLGCLLLSCVFTYACPPEHLVRPCSCGYNYLECKDIKGQDILDGVFRRLGNSKVSAFVLSNSEVEYIPSSSVARNYFQQIRVEDSILSQLFESVPSRRNIVSQLSLANVTVHSGLNFEYLKPLEKLEILDIRDMDVPHLDKEFSQSISEVIRAVVLYKTRTRSIDYAFVGKSKLEHVIVDNSSLTGLARVSFPKPTTSLLRLSFNGNQIETLPADQFDDMFKLYSVSLSGNKIREVSETVFTNVYHQLRYLFLDDNPIKCDCSIKWITLRNNEGKTITGKCVEPAHLAGKEIIDLRPSDFPHCS